MNNQSINKTKILLVSIKSEVAEDQMNATIQCIKKLKESITDNLKIFVVPSGVISSTLCVDIPENLFSISDVINGKIKSTDNINKFISMIEDELNTENEQIIPNKEELIISNAKEYLSKRQNNNGNEDPEYIYIIHNLLKIIEEYKNEK